MATNLDRYLAFEKLTLLSDYAALMTKLFLLAASVNHYFNIKISVYEKPW